MFCMVGNDTNSVKMQKRSAKSYEIARDLLVAGEINGAIHWQKIGAYEAEMSRNFREDMMLIAAR